MPYDPNLVWPQRKRCAKCRSYLLDFMVVDGLFCWYDCAGKPEVKLPPRRKKLHRPVDRPASCYKRPSKKYAEFRPKRAWDTFEEARAAAEFVRAENLLEGRVAMIAAYECANCGKFHIGNRKSNARKF